MQKCTMQWAVCCSRPKKKKMQNVSSLRIHQELLDNSATVSILVVSHETLDLIRLSAIEHQDALYLINSSWHKTSQKLYVLIAKNFSQK